MKNKEPFICPYCKETDGFRSEMPVRGKSIVYFDEFGDGIDGEMTYTGKYKEKLYCSNCNRGITKAVQKYLNMCNKED